ncbi:MAG: hypothetical protein GXO74_16325 [Calditrichaeota bacterium]|nr:hypothetical protein [Calditrichota bacterium]
MARHYIRHYYLNDTVYFLTVHTVKRECHFSSNERKKILFETICQIFRKYNYHLYAWAIFDDHYHLLFKTRIGSQLPDVVKAINVQCGVKIKTQENRRRMNPLFFNYWDVCIRTKDDFYRFFNLIHANAAKHGWPKTGDHYVFSSFRFWQWRRNYFWLKKLQQIFPPDSLNLKEDQGLHRANMKRARG